MSLAESIASGISELITIVLTSFLWAFSLKWTWNNSEKFRNIIELSYRECYFICLLIALIAD